MSEPKYYKLFHRASALTSPEFISVVEFGTDDEVYLKSEADKVIAEKDAEIAELKKQVHDYAQGLYVIQARAEKEARHQKYKRCLAMAQEWRSYAAFCGIQSSWHNNRGFGKTAEKWTWKEIHAWRCVKRWLELAKEFKEAK